MTPAPAKSAPTLLDLLAPSDDSLIAKGRRTRFAVAIEALSAGIEERAVRACLDRLDERVARGAQLRAEAAERRAQAEIDRAARAEAERDAAAEDLRDIEDALDLSLPALPAESLVSRVRRLADDRWRFHGEVTEARAEAERVRAELAREQEAYRGAFDDAVKRLDKLGRLEPIAAAAERFCRALDVPGRERSDTACAELDAATRALRALFAAPAPHAPAWAEPANEED